MLDHSFYMNLALTEAWKYQFLTYPNPAVGAVVLGDHGEILAIAAHQEAGFAHAEVLALQQAFISLTSDTNILKLNTSSDMTEAHGQRTTKNKFKQEEGNKTNIKIE